MTAELHVTSARVAKFSSELMFSNHPILQNEYIIFNQAKAEVFADIF